MNMRSERVAVAWHKRPDHVTNIDEALADVQVHGEGTWSNALSALDGADELIGDWYAVSTGNDGIVAYFAEEADALSFRLRIIDRWLNG